MAKEKTLRRLEYEKQYRIENKERLKVLNKIWREENKEYDSKRKKLWNENNPHYRKDYNEVNKERRKDLNKEWSKVNKVKNCAKTAKYKAKKINATPLWLTSEQLEEIEYFYILANDAKILTGEQYHVDHIVPLQGKNVCGLHVPWNLQILSASDNKSKGNKYVA